MERKPVESSYLKSVGYDPAKQLLEVEYANGGVYEYSGVPEKVYADMMAAESVGKFFGAKVRSEFAGRKQEVHNADKPDEGL